MEYDFGEAVALREVRFVFDSDLDRSFRNMPSSYPLYAAPCLPPSTLVQGCRLKVEDENGRRATINRDEDNHQRLRRIPWTGRARRLRLTIKLASDGDAPRRVFAFDAR